MKSKNRSTTLSGPASANPRGDAPNPASAEVFDPYLKWLGIRSDGRPPNHYKLLGLELFESDPDVIAAAADRQMAHVRRFQNGPHAVQSQELLNQLAAARVCLLRAPEKQSYDEQLRLQVLTGPPSSQSLDPRGAPVISRPSLKIGGLVYFLGGLLLLASGTGLLVLWTGTWGTERAPRPERTTIDQVDRRGEQVSADVPRSLEQTATARRDEPVLKDSPLSTSPPPDVTTEQPTQAANVQFARTEDLRATVDRAEPAMGDPNGVDVDQGLSTPGAEPSSAARSPEVARGLFSRELPTHSKKANIERYRRTGERPREQNKPQGNRDQATGEPAPDHSSYSLRRIPETDGPNRDDVRWVAFQREGASEPRGTYPALLTAMKNRDMNAAWGFLEQLEGKVATYDQRDAVDRLRMLLFHLDRFWRAVEDGTEKLQVGMSLGLEGEIHSVVTVGKEFLEIVKDQDPATKRTIPLKLAEIPLGLAIELALRDLGSRGAAAHGPIAAVLAVDREGNPGQSAELTRDLQLRGGYFPFDSPRTRRVGRETGQDAK